MKTWRWGFTVGAITAAAVLGIASCGDDDDGGGAAAPPQLDADTVRLEILSATVPDLATTARPTVTFRVLDAAGNPIDVDAELATTTTYPRLSAGYPRFTLAMLDANDDYVSYYATTRAPSAYTYIADPDVIGTTTTFVPPLGEFNADTGRVTFASPVSRSQAGQNNVARGPNLTAVAGQNRVYQFTFPTPTFTTGMDRNRTHTVAGLVSRLPNSGDTDVAHASFNFIPSGTGAVQKFETITDAACNRCHGTLQAHGSRRGVQYCITCHSPQTNDPETGRTVDFKVMIHKIHYGADLPSVRQGDASAPYYIVGNSQNVHDYSAVAFPWHDHGVGHCTVCHQGEDADNWKKKPTLAVCTSCHDNVSFVADATKPFCNDAAAKGSNQHVDCVHVVAINVPPSEANSPTLCTACHGETSAVAPIANFHHGD